MGLNRARFYREQAVGSGSPHEPGLVPKAQRGSPRRLSEAERADVLNLLLSERFVDASPRQVDAQLLQEGIYRGSYRTLYRLLPEHQAVCERRRVRRHPTYTKPELQATGPNQVWTWDITYVKTPVRGVTLDKAYAAHPPRFKARPQAGKLPETVWINAPAVPVSVGAEAAVA